MTDAKPDCRTFARLLAPLMTLALSAAPALAGQEQTPWAKSFHSQVRLIAAKKRSYGGKNLLFAGLHLRLDKKWKTYWRSPGDAGLPPHFDWSASRNVKSLRVLWPGPARYADPFGASIGYENEVVFPLAVEPVDAAKRVQIVMNFSFAVCKDICAPAEAKLKLTLGVDATPHEPLLARYMERVPAKIAPGLSGPSLAAIDIVLARPRPHITVDAVFPGNAAEGDLFIDLPPPFYIPLTRRVSTSPGGKVRFMVDLAKGDDPKELKGKTLTFTLVSPAGNRETTRLVD